MGANTIRVYGWNNTANHKQFLDYVASLDMYAMITYYIGTAAENPVATAEQRKGIVTSFAKEVGKYTNHPAILFWSFGNELNGPWNGFMGALNTAYKCHWTPPCTNNNDWKSPCVEQSDCMYGALFSWLNDAAFAARAVSDVPITTGFADVDYIIGSEGTNSSVDRLTRSEHLAPSISAWGVQLYRGKTFANAFEKALSDSKKPMVVTEYGVDAYNDPCTWPENFNNQMCFNVVSDDVGGADFLPNGSYFGCKDKDSDCARPGVETQANWGGNLTSLVLAANPDKGGAVIGGFIMAWVDEYWKNAQVQDQCQHVCSYADIETCRSTNHSYYELGGGANCAEFSHITCGNYDANYHDLCGYMIGSAPDRYCNEAWFGLYSPKSCGVSTDGRYRLDSISPRPIITTMKGLWNTTKSDSISAAVTCDDLLPCYKCLMTNTEADVEANVCSEKCFGYSIGDEKLTTLEIIGIGAGGVLFLAAVVYCFCRRKTNREEYQSLL